MSSLKVTSHWIVDGCRFCSHLIFSVFPPSPKGQSSLSRLDADAAASSSPLANGFITKETFEAPRLSKAAPEKTRDSEDRGFSRNPERDPPDPFMSRRPAPPQLQGEASQARVCVAFTGSFANLLSADPSYTTQLVKGSWDVMILWSSAENISTHVLTAVEQNSSLRERERAAASCCLSVE